MNISDTIWMSVHNLWSRKGRSLLNLSGVVVSCVLLLLTLAGTRGGREGILDIMNASEQTKRFMIFGSHDRSAKVPDEALAVPDGVSEGRRERLLQQLEKEWRNKNAKRIRLTPEHMAELRSIEQVHSIVWQNPVQCRFEWVEKAFDNQTGVETDATEKAKPTSGSLIGIDPADVRTSNRLLLGEMISRDDQQGVMIDEVTAYKLGFRTDDDLTKLIGLELKISCSLGKAAANSATNLLAGIENLLSSETIGLLRRVTKQLDRTDLSDQEKATIKNAMKLLPGSEPSIDSAKDRAPKTQSADTPDDVRIDAKGNRTLVRSGIVRGILKQPEDDDLFGFLQFTGVQRRANVYVHHHVTEEIYSRRVGFVDYWAVAGSVSAVADLPEAIERIESLGFGTRDRREGGQRSWQSALGGRCVGAGDSDRGRNRNLQHHDCRRVRANDRVWHHEVTWSRRSARIEPSFAGGPNHRSHRRCGCGRDFVRRCSFDKPDRQKLDRGSAQRPF
jgi:hypothetical protein